MDRPIGLRIHPDRTREAQHPTIVEELDVEDLSAEKINSSANGGDALRQSTAASQLNPPMVVIKNIINDQGEQTPNTNKKQTCFNLHPRRSKSTSHPRKESPCFEKQEKPFQTK
jgi:hypothetical protein